jgi:MarR family transcriptional regulator, organic hydroperoxide resistance regulator
MTAPAPSPASREQPFAPFLCFSIYAAGLAFNRLYKSVLDRWGLTYPQYLVMVALREGDDRSVGELGELLFLESNTLTPMLKRLEAAGLVERRRDCADERVVRIRLSPQGRIVAQDLTCVPGDMLAAVGHDGKGEAQGLESLPELIAAIDAVAAKLRRAASR